MVKEHAAPTVPICHIPEWTPTQVAVAACCWLKGIYSNNPMAHKGGVRYNEDLPVFEWWACAGKDHLQVGELNSLGGSALAPKQRAALTVWRGHSTNPVRALGCQHTALLWGANHSTPVSYLSKLQNSLWISQISSPGPAPCNQFTNTYSKLGRC